MQSVFIAITSFLLFIHGWVQIDLYMLDSWNTIDRIESDIITVEVWTGEGIYFIDLPETMFPEGMTEGESFFMYIERIDH